METGKKKRRSIWWSLLLVFIYLWMQVMTALAFALFAGVRYALKLNKGDSDLVFGIDPIPTELSAEFILLILFVSAVLSLALCFLVYKLRKIPIADHLKWRIPPARLIFSAIPTGLSIEFVSIFLFSITAIFFKKSAESYESMVQGLVESPFAFIVIGIIAPIVEDLIFRGFILNELRKDYSLKTALIIQAVLFGVMHLNVAQGLYAVLAGLVLGLIAVEAKSVIPAIIGHIVMNSSALLLSNVQEDTLATLFLPIVMMSVFFMFFAVRRAVRGIKASAVENAETAE